MAVIRAGKKQKEIRFVVFDKDGLMFQSQPFWTELGNERMRKIRQYIPEEAVLRWAKLNGLTYENGSVVHTDPKGILATASPREECSVTAAFLLSELGLSWDRAIFTAHEIFLAADRNLSLARALVPRKGFPQILPRLRAAGIPYAVATSDTLERVVESFRLVKEEPPELIVFPDMVEHGKPAADMLIYIAEKTGIPMNAIAMIGDSYVDVKMASFAGAFGIGVPETEEMREHMLPYADCIVDSLDEIEIIP